jgi:elongation factor Ts
MRTWPLSSYEVEHMAITAAAVKELRDRTGAGMMDCKKALTEAEGDMDEAIKILRTKGLSAAAKKAGRAANDGMVAIAGDDTKKAILELNCETEPVSRLDTFREFGDALVQQVLDTGATSSDELKSQPFAADPAHTVEESVSLKIAVIGENIVLNRCTVVEGAAGNKLASYVHMCGKIGVVVEGSASLPGEALHDVALHIAATEPRYTNRDEVTEKILATEREIALQQAIDSGKPPQIAEKIVTGKMEKFFESEVLLEQPFAKDSSKSVAEYLREQGGETATIAGFVRYKLGDTN